MRRRTGVASCLLIFILIGALERNGFAQDAVQEKRPRVEFGLAGWVMTQGETKWAHDASNLPGPVQLGNPTSKLTYKDVGTNIIEGTVRLWVTPKWFGRLTGGFGVIGGGRLTDDDYLAADGGAPSSQTFSDLKGDSTWYVNADVGRRVVEFPHSRGYLDVFGGYQFWYQRYTANGVGQQVCSTAAQTAVNPPLCTPNASLSSAIPVITNTTQWHSIRVGGSVEYRLTRRFSVQSTIALIPLSILDNKDIHHRRPDLSQDPSLSMLGYAVGADADIGARVMIIRNLFASVGYRVWWNRMVDGTVTFHGSDGSTSDFDLTEFQTFRHGITFGLNYSF